MGLFAGLCLRYSQTMRLDNMRESQNVEDRRGRRGPGGRTMVGGGLGIGGIILVLVFVLLGGNPQQLLGPGGPIGGGGGGGGLATPYVPTAAEAAAEKVVRKVLGDTEQVWTELFAAEGARYEPPTLVLFSGATETGCGYGDAATGPFYCPADQTIYIDLSFYTELSSRFGAPGDFAQAYVIAHEVGHHVQNLLGISGEVQETRQRVSEVDANNLSVRLELQADYLAGVWAHHANKSRSVLEVGDIEEGLRAASAIGDDRLQKQSRGYAVPDSFTHGSSEQRVRWFRKGLESGKMSAGDTFGAERL